MRMFCITFLSSEPSLACSRVPIEKGKGEFDLIGPEIWLCDAAVRKMRQPKPALPAEPTSPTPPATQTEPDGGIQV
jgi:hypothetical protein